MPNSGLPNKASLVSPRLQTLSQPIPRAGQFSKFQPHSHWLLRPTWPTNNCSSPEIGEENFGGKGRMTELSGWAKRTYQSSPNYFSAFPIVPPPNSESSSSSTSPKTLPTTQTLSPPFSRPLQWPPEASPGRSALNWAARWRRRPSSSGPSRPLAGAWRGRLVPPSSGLRSRFAA